jgi:hypothetical protein
MDLLIEEISRQKNLMYYKVGETPTENNIYSIIEGTYVFDPFITDDDRFLVVNDTIFDIKEQKEIGSLFNLDNLKYLLSNLTISETNESYVTIKESIDSFISLPITESVIDLSFLKEFILEQESLLDKAIGYGKKATSAVSQTAKSVGKKVSQLGSGALEQLKSLGGDALKWGKEVLSAIGSGALAAARWLKDAMFTIGGIAVDAFLVATGIGKSVQWIPWAIILTLDIYQWTANDYPNGETPPTWWKIMEILFSVIGLVTTGVAAKAAKSAILPFKGLKVGEAVAKSPMIKKVVTQSVGLVSKVPNILNKAVTTLSTKAPKIAEWMKGILPKVTSVLQSIVRQISKIFGLAGKVVDKTVGQIGKNVVVSKTGGTLGKGLSSATKQAALAAGVTAAVTPSSGGYSETQLQNLKTYQDVINKNYGGKDPFDM